VAICGPEDSVYSCGQKWKAALRQREAEAHRLLLQQYGEAYQWLRDELTATLQAIEQAEGEVSPGKLWQSQRLKALLQQMDSEMARLAQVAAGETTKAQADAVNMASQATAEMLGLVGVDFAAFPHEAFTTLVGLLADGSPLAEYLAATLPAEAAGVLRQSLLVGLAAGWNPRKAARYAAQKATGLALSKAMTTARTEMLRAYREATRAAYERSEVVEGWIWSAAKDRRVCPACLALDCKEFPTSQPMEGHPNCRCTMLPKIAGVTYRKTCGRDWLAKQPPEVQDEILGKAGGLAFRAGAVRLEDFVGHKHDRRWGGMHYSRSLKEILGDEANLWKSATQKARWMRELAEGKERVLLTLTPREVSALWGYEHAAGIVLPRERREHYLWRHPDVRPYEGLLVKILSHPDEVHRNKDDAGVAIFYLRVGERFLRAAVAMRPYDGGLQPFLLSLRWARVTEVEKGKRDGRKVWP